MSETNLPVIPFPLRADLTVKIHGIPHDFTQEEAERVCNFIMAFVEKPKDNQND